MLGSGPVGEILARLKVDWLVGLVPVYRERTDMVSYIAFDAKQSVRLDRLWVADLHVGKVARSISFGYDVETGRSLHTAQIVLSYAGDVDHIIVGKAVGVSDSQVARVGAVKNAVFFVGFAQLFVVLFPRDLSGWVAEHAALEQGVAASQYGHVLGLQVD